MQSAHFASNELILCLNCMVFHQDGPKCFWKEALVLFVVPSQSYAYHISYMRCLATLESWVTSFTSVWICKYFCYFSYLFHCISESGITYICIAEEVGNTIEHCTTLMISVHSPYTQIFCFCIFIYLWSKEMTLK